MCALFAAISARPEVGIKFLLTEASAHAVEIYEAQANNQLALWPIKSATEH